MADLDGGEPVVTGTYLVAGAGVSGLGTAKLLAAAGIPFVVADDNPGKLAELEAAVAASPALKGTTNTAAAAAELARFTTVVTSPGWRPDSPLLVDAASHGLEVIGDVELCFRLDRAGTFGPPRDWLVVTGTNGKTTTTGMLAEIMQQAATYTGRRAAACGNIGVAVGDALLAQKRVDVLVAELSSFQLHWSDTLVPNAGVLLNLADDHIDWHGSFEEYAAAKAKVFRSSVAVAGVDDSEVLERARATGREDIVGFTAGKPGPGQVGIVDGEIVSRVGGATVRITKTEGIEPPGMAGVLDALAATAVAVTQGASPEQIDAALHNYRVSGHRGAVVHSADGVDWIDNSKATNPHAADSALQGARDGSVVWIAGGQLKGADVDELVQTHAHRFRAVALLGADRDQLASAVEKYAPGVPVFLTDSTDPAQAMGEVVGYAATQARAGDSVILAPAAASLDMYSGMAERGNLFASAARGLN